MKLNFSRYAPPGYDLKAEKATFFCGMILSILFSSSFLIRLLDAERSLYEYIGEKRYLLPDAIMPDFVDILGNALSGFLIMALFMASFIIMHYVYHHQHSKSIYLMRRLPNPLERHRRCITLPLLAIAAYILVAFMVLILYYVIYLQTTPEGCLAPDQWQKIWRAFL